MKNFLKIILINIFALVLFIGDRISKLYIIKNPDSVSRRRDFSIDNIIGITPVKNHDSALGLKIPLGIIIILSLVAILFLFVLLKKNYKEKKIINILTLTVIIFGAISNILDRIFLGYVIDFIDIPWFSTFNFADIFIVGGVLVLAGREINWRKKSKI